MRETDAIVEHILDVFQESGVAQVSGYAPFRFVGRAAESVIVERQNGNEARIPLSILRRAVEAVRKDHSVYKGGPSRLREHGITHVTSPTWALIRLLPLSELTE